MVFHLTHLKTTLTTNGEILEKTHDFDFLEIMT